MARATIDKGDTVIIDNPQSSNYGAIGTVLYWYTKYDMWLVSFPRKLKTVHIETGNEVSYNVFLLPEVSLKKLTGRVIHD